MKHPGSALRAAVAVVVGATVLAFGGVAGATSTDPASCIGIDRSDPAWPNGAEFAALLVQQHEFDRLNDNPASFGRSMAYAASTNCGSR
jgi:hypothetical protein